MFDLKGFRNSFLQFWFFAAGAPPSSNECALACIVISFVLHLSVHRSTMKMMHRKGESPGIAGFVSNLLFGAGSNDENDSGNNVEGEGGKNGKGGKKDRLPTMHDLPKLIEDMVNSRGSAGSIAAKKIYELSDVAHKQNRIPMVCDTKYDVLKALTECLTHLNDYEEEEEEELVGGHVAKNDEAVATSSSKDDNERTREDGFAAQGDDKLAKSADAKQITPQNSNDDDGKTIEAVAPSTKQQEPKKRNEKLHFVCLSLNNLSIPDENKRIMALERGSKTLIRNLSQVIAAGKKEAYLCCICLMNLSFLESSATKILQFSPKATTIQAPINGNNAKTTAAATAASKTKAAAKKVKLILLRGGRTVPSPLENPNSLLRILQDLLAHASRGTLDFRWAFGLLSNLSKHPDNASLIGQTAIPRVAIENIRVSATHPKEWKTNSLEDFSLLLLLYLSSACYNDATAAMSTSLFDISTAQAALDVLTPVMDKAEGTLQGLKATMICAFLEAPWSSFPKYGIPAAACLSELMANTYERVGKKGVYSRNIFSLHMATKAYGDLARAAAKADNDESMQEQGKSDEQEAPSNDTNTADATSATPSKLRIVGTSSQHTKVVALPTAVALLFQIIADVALISSPDALDSTEHSDDGPLRADMRAAEYAVSAVNALLPALLKADDPPRHSRQTEQACSQLEYMLTSYTKKPNCPIASKARAKEAAELITAASSSAMPILEASYDLWVQSQSSYF